MKTLLSAVFFLIISFQLSAQIANWNFELGRNAGWVEQSSFNNALIGTAQFFYSTEISPTVIPYSGNMMARIGGFSYEENAIGQVVQLPNITPLYLGFRAQTRSASISECNGLWVGAKISIIINNQEVYSARLCKYNDLLDWTPLFIDLSAIAGTSATIVFKGEAMNTVWSYLYIDDVRLTSSVSGINDNGQLLSFGLKQNYPNPFNPTTTIPFTIDKKSHVSLKIFDLLGREVNTVVSEELEAGVYSREFIASALPSGIYYYVLKTDNNTEQKKMIYLK